MKKHPFLVLLVILTTSCSAAPGRNDLLPDIIVGEHNGLSIIKGKTNNFILDPSYLGEGTITYEEVRNHESAYFLAHRTLRRQRFIDIIHFRIFPSFVAPPIVNNTNLLFGIGYQGINDDNFEADLLIHDFMSTDYALKKNNYQENMVFPYYFDIFIPASEIDLPIDSSNTNQLRIVLFSLNTDDEIKEEVESLIIDYRIRRDYIDILN